MPLIEWTDDFRTGVEAVDHEHRRLIELINDLHASLRETAGDDEVAAFLGELHARIAAHFALEETLMREADYPELGPHKADHERLLDDIREIMDNHERGRYAHYEQVLSAHLRDWFARHFRDMDRSLQGRLG